MASCASKNHPVGQTAGFHSALLVVPEKAIESQGIVSLSTAASPIRWGRNRLGCRDQAGDLGANPEIVDMSEDLVSQVPFKIEQQPGRSAPRLVAHSDEVDRSFRRS